MKPDSDTLLWKPSWKVGGKWKDRLKEIQAEKNKQRVPSIKQPVKRKVKP